MTTRYVDSTFGAQGARKVWGSGSHATDPGSLWYTTIASAYAASSDGDVLKIWQGTYAMPAIFEKSLTLGCTGSVTLTYTPPGSPTEAESYCNVDLDKTLKIIGATISASMGVRGSLVLYECPATVNGKIYGSGSVIGIGTMKHNLQQASAGAYEQYASYFREGRWPSQFSGSNYRNKGVLEAAAKHRDQSGQTKVRWVAIDEFRYMIRDGTGGERMAEAVSMADQPSTMFTRPGLPAHQDMRVRTQGRTMQIVGVSRPSGPGSDLKLFVKEYTGM